MARCTAKTKHGKRCRITGGVRLGPDGDAVCLHHDVSRRKLAQRIRGKGGKVAQDRKLRPATPPPTLRTLDDCVTWSAWVASAVATGTIDVKKAQETTRAINQFVKSFEAAGQIKDLKRQLRDALKRIQKKETRK